MMAIYPIIDPEFMIEFEAHKENLHAVEVEFLMNRETNMKVILVLVNFMFGKKFSLPLNLLAAICCSRSLFYKHENEDSNEEFNEYLKFFIIKVIRFLIEQYLTFLVFDFFRVEAMREEYMKNKHHTETDRIMNNLEEAIITKSINGIGYCNKRGFKVISDINDCISNS